MAPTAAADECRSLDAVGWLLGDWSRPSERSVTREWWRRVSDGTFEGESTTASASTGETLRLETLRLVAMSDGVFYIAKVTENDLPVPFRMTQCTDGIAVFKNPAHDAPQKLTYRHFPGQGQGRMDEMEVTVEGGTMTAFTLRFVRDGGS
jgi:hypothetical protein